MTRLDRPSSLVLLAAALAMGACSGSGGSSSGGGSGSSGGGSGSSGGGSGGTMTATIGYPDGGTSDAGIAGPFTATKVTTQNPSTGNYSVAGVAANKDTISLVFYSLTDAGTYPVKHFSNTEVTYNIGSQNTGNTAESGSITITTFDAKGISGTFNFSGKIRAGGSEQFEVTNGQFSATW